MDFLLTLLLEEPTLVLLLGPAIKLSFTYLTDNIDNIRKLCNSIQYFKFKLYKKLKCSPCFLGAVPEMTWQGSVLCREHPEWSEPTASERCLWSPNPCILSSPLPAWPVLQKAPGKVSPPPWRSMLNTKVKQIYSTIILRLILMLLTNIYTFFFWENQTNFLTIGDTNKVTEPEHSPCDNTG